MPAGTFRTHKLTLCYELAADFAVLYTDYGAASAQARRAAATKSRKRKSK